VRQAATQRHPEEIGALSYSGWRAKNLANQRRFIAKARLAYTRRRRI